MLAILESPLEAVHDIPVSREQRKALLTKLLQFFQLQLPGFKTVNTPDILDLVM